MNVSTLYIDGKRRELNKDSHLIVRYSGWYKVTIISTLEYMNYTPEVIQFLMGYSINDLRHHLLRQTRRLKYQKSINSYWHTYELYYKYVEKFMKVNIKEWKKFQKPDGYKYNTKARKKRHAAYVKRKLKKEKAT